MLDTKTAENLANIMDTVTEVAETDFKLAFDPTLVRGMSYYTEPSSRFPWKALAVPLQAAEDTTR